MVSLAKSGKPNPAAMAGATVDFPLRSGKVVAMEFRDPTDDAADGRRGTSVPGGLGARLAARARRFGPLKWSEFMDAALYDPLDGFYEAGGHAGRRGDFLTSPELGPLFATAVAAALDAVWEELGRPDPFVVVEAAAGAGTLARDVLAAAPGCSPALRYVLVERSASLRALQQERLALEEPAMALGPALPNSDPDEDEAVSIPGTGPLVTSLAELPSLALTGVMLANELLDNLAVDLLEWRERGWHEVRVAAVPGTDEDLMELLVPAPQDQTAEATRLAGGTDDLVEGARIPVERAAVAWLRQALSVLQEGRLIVIDYADATPGLARTPPAGWLRTFRQHQAALSPLEAPGTQDITCVVATDQLAELQAPDADRSQAEWLKEHGLDRMVAAAKTEWQAGAAVGGLSALAARSRVHEAEALTDPTGLGSHRVLEWKVGRRS